MRILVTGANGLLGQKLVSRLMQDPAVEVVATARKPFALFMPRGFFATLDIGDATQTKETLLRYRPDVVINTAAMTQVDQCETDREACWRANVDSMTYLVAGCEAVGAHLIHVSTDFVFDGTHGPLDESAQPAPVNFYGESKLAGEKIVQESQIKWAILRTVLVYGITADMSRTNIVLWVKNSLQAGKKIQVVNDQWRTPTLAEDLAQGCHLAAIKKATGIYHISGEEMMTPYDIAIATARFFKLDAGLIEATDSTRFTQPAKRPMKTGFIIGKAKRELGYRPHTFAQGLAVVASQING
jgi:dTDP-4-dehydrorhamnose reductase